MRWNDGNGVLRVKNSRKRWHSHILLSSSIILFSVSFFLQFLFNTSIFHSIGGGGRESIDSDQEEWNDASVNLWLALFRLLFTPSLTLSVFHLQSYSELYLFFFCLIRESIASHHHNDYCGWEVAKYAMFKKKHECTSHVYEKRHKWETSEEKRARKRERENSNSSL